MKETELRGENRVPIALRIKLRYRKIDTFVSKFATNISSNGMFISSRKPKEKGTLLRFELRLADDSTVIAGRGKVAWVRDFDPAHPKRPHGMGIEFTSLSQGSRELITQIVARRVEQGLGEADEIPFTASRRTPPPPTASQDPASPEVPTPAPPAPAAEALAAERVSHTGVPTMAMDDIETVEIDLRAAVARARALVGSVELDDELERLYRVSAAPVAETVDEASNDLARMLGGQAVQSKRIRHVDPPTGVDITAAPPADDDDASADEAIEADEARATVGAAVEARAALEADDDDASADEADEADEARATLGAADEACAALEADDASEAVQTLGLVDSVVASLAAESAQQEDSSNLRYARAQTDPSPDIIGEFDAEDGIPPRISEAIDAQALIIGETPTVEVATREAPMHLCDGNEESLDIDIDEATPAPEAELGLADDEPGTELADLAIIDAAALVDDDDNDFSESADNTMGLTDLIELPPNLEIAEEIDVDFD